MSERDTAIVLAKSILDDNGRDPDSDASVLARQLLREIERAEAGGIKIIGAQRVGSPEHKAKQAADMAAMKDWPHGIVRVDADKMREHMIRLFDHANDMGRRGNEVHLLMSADPIGTMIIKDN